MEFRSGQSTVISYRPFSLRNGEQPIAIRSLHVGPCPEPNLAVSKANIVGQASGLDTVAYNSPGAAQLIGSFPQQTSAIAGLNGDIWPSNSNIVNIVNYADSFAGNNHTLQHVGQEVILDTDPLGATFANLNFASNFSSPTRAATADLQSQGLSRVLHNHSIETLQSALLGLPASVLSLPAKGTTCAAPTVPTDGTVVARNLSPETTNSSTNVGGHQIESKQFAPNNADLKSPTHRFN
jgi:hypothetical protein